MKKIILFLFILGLGLSAHAQETCSKLSESFTPQNLAQVADRLEVSEEYACTVANKGVLISDRSTRDLSNLTDLKTLRPAFPEVEWITEENFNAETFNILLYEFEIKEKEIQQFRVGNTGMVVQLLSKLRMGGMIQE